MAQLLFDDICGCGHSLFDGQQCLLDDPSLFWDNPVVRPCAFVKPVRWIGPTLAVVSRFPEDAKDVIGQALFEAQTGGKSGDAKPMKGHLRDVMEIVVNSHQTANAYRVIYTTKIGEIVYVIHAFEKKSKHGRETPDRELRLVVRRLNRARVDYAEQAELK